MDETSSRRFNLKIKCEDVLEDLNTLRLTFIPSKRSWINVLITTTYISFRHHPEDVSVKSLWSKRSSQLTCKLEIINIHLLV